MFAALRASTSRAAARSFSSSARVAAKAPLRESAEAPTPADLLSKIGRNADKKLAEKAETWDALNSIWMKGKPALEAAGMGIKERRFILWAFSRYSQGDAPSSFLFPPKPAKTIRGWGPRVQHGKRIK